MVVDNDPTCLSIVTGILQACKYEGTNYFVIPCVYLVDHEFFKMTIFPFSSLLVVHYEKAANALEAIQKRTGRLN